MILELGEKKKDFMKRVEEEKKYQIKRIEEQKYQIKGGVFIIKGEGSGGGGAL